MGKDANATRNVHRREEIDRLGSGVSVGVHNVCLSD